MLRSKDLVGITNYCLMRMGILNLGWRWQNALGDLVFLLGSSPEELPSGPRWIGLTKDYLGIGTFPFPNFYSGNGVWGNFLWGHNWKGERGLPNLKTAKLRVNGSLGHSNPWVGSSRNYPFSALGFGIGRGRFLLKNPNFWELGFRGASGPWVVKEG